MVEKANACMQRALILSVDHLAGIVKACANYHTDQMSLYREMVEERDAGLSMQLTKSLKGLMSWLMVVSSASLLPIKSSLQNLAGLNRVMMFA